MVLSFQIIFLCGCIVRLWAGLKWSRVPAALCMTGGATVEVYAVPCANAVRNADVGAGADA